MGADEAGCMTPVVATFLEQHQVGMKVVRQRNHEEEQHHGADECGRFAPGCVAPKASLSRPPGAPRNDARQRDQDPQGVEE